ncbi:MAG: nucleoside deaminase [Bacteroidia bacterium]|jgi:tRNA(Arg) A34 adenosine deaminase TadA|nr:nucleoside deaminase [Bacteroidia bacterium]MCC6768793.1 nucleoside deaminase [Bacteroidia bacterium]
MQNEPTHIYWMREAISLSQEGMKQGQGGPFGAIVVKDNKIIGKGFNRVLGSNDPTAHAEVEAIRDACKNLGSFQLEGCVIYTSCEPCPMCMGAIYWARPAAVYYANNRQDAADIGFDDDFIYQELAMPLNMRKLPIKELLREEALQAFRAWTKKDDRTSY